MPHFSRRLSTQEGNLTFYFNRIVTAGGTRYHVSVIDSRRKMQIFHFNEEGTKWKLLSPESCPPWILALENILATEIIKHITEGD